MELWVEHPHETADWPGGMLDLWRFVAVVDSPEEARQQAQLEGDRVYEVWDDDGTVLDSFTIGDSDGP